MLKRVKILTKGCRWVEIRRQLEAKPVFLLHKVIQSTLLQNVPPGQLLLQVEDPAIVKIKVEKPSGGGRQVAVSGKVTHQADCLVAR